MPKKKTEKGNPRKRQETKFKKRSSDETKELIIQGLAAGLSQAEICRQYGLSKGYVSKVANRPENALKINSQLEQHRQESFEDLKAFVRFQNQSFVDIANRISRMLLIELRRFEADPGCKEARQNIDLLSGLWKMVQTRFCDHQISLKEAAEENASLSEDDKAILEAWKAQQ